MQWLSRMGFINMITSVMNQGVNLSPTELTVYQDGVLWSLAVCSLVKRHHHNPFAQRKCVLYHHTTDKQKNMLSQLYYRRVKRKIAQIKI